MRSGASVTSITAGLRTQPTYFLFFIFFVIIIIVLCRLLMLKFLCQSALIDDFKSHRPPLWYSSSSSLTHTHKIVSSIPALSHPLPLFLSISSLSARASFTKVCVFAENKKQHPPLPLRHPVPLRPNHKAYAVFFFKCGGLKTCLKTSTQDLIQWPQLSAADSSSVDSSFSSAVSWRSIPIKLYVNHPQM